MRLFFVFCLFISFSLNAQQYHLLVGTYNSTGSEGIFTFRFDAQTGKATPISSVKTSNPSYLAVSPDQKYVFAVNENDSGTVSAFKFNKENGGLTFLNSVSSAGAHPCYISLNKSATIATVGNYSSGTISVMEIRPDGQLNQPKQIIQLKGNSVNRKRQEKSHVHATVYTPDFRFLLVPDLGTDKIMQYKVTPASGALQASEKPYTEVHAGAGPRHLDFHPKLQIVYLIEELTGSISVFKYKEGKLELIQNSSTHPLSYVGAFGSADIHVSPDGRFLYASNRGDANNIAVFNIDQESGMIQIAGFQPTLGIHPRNFAIDPTGNYLLVANRDSNEIVVFKIDKKTGLLEYTNQRISVQKPVCIKWIVTK